MRVHSNLIDGDTRMRTPLRASGLASSPLLSIVLHGFMLATNNHARIAGRYQDASSVAYGFVADVR